MNIFIRNGYEKEMGLSCSITLGHYNAHAMPSAGILPFVQGAVCSASNYCNRSSTSSETPGSAQVYSGAGINNVMDALYGAYAQFTPTRQTQIAQLISNLNQAAELYPLVQNSTNLINTIASSVRKLFDPTSF